MEEYNKYEEAITENVCEKTQCGRNAGCDPETGSCFCRGDPYSVETGCMEEGKEDNIQTLKDEFVQRISAPYFEIAWIFVTYAQFIFWSY